MILNQGDDNVIFVPTVFIFVFKISVVVNQNIHQGLKLVNGAGYTTIDIIFDKAYPGHRINADIVLYFDPPVNILLTSKTTKDLHFISISPGTILLTPINIPIPYQRKRV